ncbi:sodium/hydrogen exchanger family-like protein [Fragilaria crotonensis]|nr:sodium/hydrogen exchanger family-like protein [Fragilaria crotonensis]
MIHRTLHGIVLALLLAGDAGAIPFQPKCHALHSKDLVDLKSPAVVNSIPRGGDNLVVEAAKGLKDYIAGPKTDTLLLFLTVALNTPICNKIGLSPILGYLAAGTFMGPAGKNLIKDVHTTEMLADVGIVFFLFEMGIHLSFNTLMKMRRTVFGLGGSQFLVTAIAVGTIAVMGFGVKPEAAVILGGGLALSSSAFVLQLLKDKGQLNTEYGRSSFGVLLLQDLMVVPLLVITPLLAGKGGSLTTALSKAGVQIVMALSAIMLAGKFLLNPLFDNVLATNSEESLIGVILLTVLGMSYFTEGLGLSNTLGPFLLGVLLADHPLHKQIEQAASPIRGVLVGLFFLTVGFEIDLKLIASKAGLITGLVVSLLSLKTVIATSLAQAFGVDKATSKRVGLVLSQGGEFAFVAFRMARSYGILSADVTKLMLTVVSLTMAATPLLEDYGASIMAAAVPKPEVVAAKAIKSIKVIKVKK